jgi:hypothetical protein
VRGSSGRTRLGSIARQDTRTRRAASQAQGARRCADGCGTTRFTGRLLRPFGALFHFEAPPPDDPARLASGDVDELLAGVLTHAQRGAFAPTERLAARMLADDDAWLRVAGTKLLAHATPPAVLRAARRGRAGGRRGARRCAGRRPAGDPRGEHRLRPARLLPGRLDVDAAAARVDELRAVGELGRYRVGGRYFFGREIPG